MDAKQVTQQMISYQKQTFNSFQSAWEMAQTQTSSAMDKMMDQATWMPSQGRQALENWRSLMKAEQERFTAYVDRSFAIYEKMVTAPQAVTPVKKQKTNDTK
jgi:hypothetical protein